MKYIMCSRVFPVGHPRQSEPTWFVEKILNSIGGVDYNELKPEVKGIVNIFQLSSSNEEQKHHTIRANNRYKPGDMVSLRVWQLPGGMYTKGNKQIEFVQVEVKKTWEIEIDLRYDTIYVKINGHIVDTKTRYQIASNDGLSHQDFINWFAMHPKKNGGVFTGQIICWSDKIEYNHPSILTEKVNS